MTTVPCAGLVVDVTVRPVPMSLASTLVPLSAVSAGVAPVSLAAVGVTETVTVAVEVCPAASVTV